jgi:plasmid stabilization system protein ParE
MAGRAAGRFYIYCFIDGHEIVYVGKGSGLRVKQQAKRFGCEHKILEWLDDEVKAYEREKHWIAQLQPTRNQNAGGGGYVSPVDFVPKQLRGVISARAWRKELEQHARELADIDRIGSRRYAARTLVNKLDERNCETFGVSKVELNRLREVANGPRC